MSHFYTMTRNDPIGRSFRLHPVNLRARSLREAGAKVLLYFGKLPQAERPIEILVFDHQGLEHLDIVL